VHAEKHNRITVLQSLKNYKFETKLSKDSSKKSKDISLGPKVKSWTELFNLELPSLRDFNFMLLIIDCFLIE